MNTQHKNLINQVADKAKSTIDVFPTVPTFDLTYWKGYCNGIEDANGLGRNDIYIPVKVICLEYCDKLRNLQLVAGIAG